MSDELRFDVIGQDKGASDAFSRVGWSVSAMGDKIDAAATKSMYLDDALKRQAETARRGADASLSLARSDAILAEVEGRLRDGALEAEFALKKETEAKKADAEASRKAAAENQGFAASLARVAAGMKDKGGPAWLGPALLALGPLTGIAGVAAGATVGIAGAAVAGAAALAAFGAVARPVLSQALAAEQAVQSAQDAYTLSVANTTGQYRIAMDVAKTSAQRTAAYAAEQKGFAADRLAEAQAVSKAYIEMSPQQIALSKQLGDMANAWQNLKAAETPVVAGALQPWLKSVTDLTGQLGPVIARVSVPVHDLGVQFGTLVSSSAFGAFAAWVGTTGSAVVRSAGNAVLDLVTGLVFLLPQLNPLIKGASDGISRWGDAFVRWSASARGARDIQGFLGWFKSNGPVVAGLLENIGGALKALAPGLGPASVTEMNMISGFFATIAKLPASVAKPLLDVAGVLLTLNKLGVVGVGIKVLGLGGAGAGAAGAGEAAAGGAAAGGLWGRLFPGARLLGGGTLAIGLAVGVGIRTASDASARPGTAEGATKQIIDSQHLVGYGGTAMFSGFTSWIAVTLPHLLDGMQKHTAAAWNAMWNNTIGRLNNGVNDSDRLLGGWEHNVARVFDTARHDVGVIWGSTWDNTVGRLNRGMNDSDRLLGGWEHDVAHWFDVGRHDAASSWDSLWSSTAARAASGVDSVMHWVGTIPGRIEAAFANAGRWLFGFGQALVQGAVAGIESVGGSIASALESLVPAPARSVLSGLWHGLGFASGTDWAPAGWAWVGERGPELMRFRGGEQVMPAHASAASAAARGGGITYNINVSVSPAVAAVTPDGVLGRQIAQHVTRFISHGGSLYPAGVTPR